MTQKKFWFALILAATMVAAPSFAADVGVTVYAKTNCFIFKTVQGNTLFERSGGGAAVLKQKVKGVLHDFGYQEIKDEKGKSLLVGFIQNFGVNKPAEIEEFKKNCR